MVWYKGEACFYDGKTFTILKNKDRKAFTNVWSIIEDKKGDIWFGGSIVEDKRGDTLVVLGGLGGTMAISILKYRNLVVLL